MKVGIVTVAAALLALPAAVQAQTPQQNSGAATGAVGGAVTGAVVGGPVGAVIGGAVGAIAGGTLSAPQSQQVQQYVVTQRRPSVQVTEQVVVGGALPPTVELYAVPAEAGIQTQYRYTVVNDRTVLVDPSTRRVIQVIE